MTEIVITQPPSNITPDNPTSYFPQFEGLVKWTDAHQRVSGADRRQIPAGTQLAVLLEVTQSNDGQLLLMVANASCSADLFRLQNLTTDDEETLRPYIGTTVAAKLVIHKRDGNQGCHGSRYIVEPGIVLAPLPFNPTADQLRTMSMGAHFVVQGTFVRYYEVAPGKYMPDTNDYKTRGYIVIRVPSGEDVLLDSARPHTKEPCYDGGVLENLSNKRMIPGETIRITGFISNDRYSDRLPPGTATVGYNRPYLLVPDPERLAEYTQLREQVRNGITTLQCYASTLQWPSTRREFAQLRQLELTNDESQQIIQIMEEVPAEHRSVYYTRQFGADEISRAFGIDPETLNREEFLVYAREILHGERENPSRESGNRTDSSYILRVWGTNHCVLRPDDLVNLLVSTIPVRLERLERAGDEHDDYWEDLFLLETCIKYVSYEKDVDVDPRLVRAVMAVIEHCFKNEYYILESELEFRSRDRRCPRRLDDVMRTCFDALANAWMYQPVVREIITPQVMSEWVSRLTDAGADLEVIRDLRQRVPRR